MDAPQALGPSSPDAAGAVPARGAAIALGVALGGFFDGIVLHQVLQWHHLLSAVSAPAFADLRVQVLADGLFHAAMYVIAAIALWRLARAPSRPSPRRLLGWVLIGFAGWHALDAVLSHWLLGLHRIRMDTDVPLAWDLGWLAVFGAVPAWIGATLARGDGGSSTAAPAHRGTVLSWTAVAAVAAGIAAQPPAARADGSTDATVVLRSAAHAPRMLAALPDDARIVGSDRDGLVWQVRLPPGARASRLYAHGALWVAGAGLPAGCAAWMAP